MDQIPRTLRAFAMEFIGTFSLLFIGGWSVFNGDTEHTVLFPAIFHGVVLGVMVYIGAQISGSHFNPAVTLGLTVTAKINPLVALGYIVF